VKGREKVLEGVGRFEGREGGKWSDLKLESPLGLASVAQLYTCSLP
jgi:hypothetical protein